MANDFDHVSPRELGRDVRVQSSPAGCAMNLINDYGVMIPLRLEQALALRDWLNEHFPRDADRVPAATKEFP